MSSRPEARREGPTSPSPEGTAAAPSPQQLPAGFLSRHPWLTFLLPFVVYMLVGSLEPGEEGVNLFGFWILYEHYPLVYTTKIVLTVSAMLLVLPGYLTFRRSVSWLAPVVGIVGVVLWIGLCHLDLEAKLLGGLGWDFFREQGERPAYNPLHYLKETPGWAYGFLGIRLFGLAVVVPVIEEFFLRGFLMRFVIDRDWWKVPFGQVTTAALVFGTLVPMLMHPAELLAALVWFSLVHWLMLRTRSMWDCVIAHAVTNLLLGIYVISSGRWELM